MQLVETQRQRGEHIFKEIRQKIFTPALEIE